MSTRARLRNWWISLGFAALACGGLAAAQESGRTPVQASKGTAAQLAEVRAKIAALQQQMRELVEQLETLSRTEYELSKAQALENGASREEAEQIVNQGRDARELSREWVADAVQIQDAAKRTAALDSIRYALRAGDPEASHAALFALAQIAKVEYDKASFRADVLPYLDASDREVGVAAFYALYNTRKEPQDIERVLAFARVAPPKHKNSALHLLFLFNEGDLTGRAGDAALALLASDDPRELHATLSGLWGARVSPALAARLIELARSSHDDLRHNAIYFGLSTLEDKSPEVVDELIAVLSDSDHENSGRALWGLEHSVLPEARPKLVAAMFRFLESRSDPRERESALRIIGRYGAREDVPKLEALAANPLAEEAQRDAVRKALEKLRAK